MKYIHSEWFVNIFNSSYQKTPVSTLFLILYTVHCSKDIQASYSARVVCVMLRASKLIRPCGHVIASLVGSGKTQTQWVNRTCCLKRSATFWAPAPRFFFFFFCVFVKVKGRLLQISVAGYLSADFLHPLIHPVLQYVIMIWNITWFARNLGLLNKTKTCIGQ